MRTPRTPASCMSCELAIADVLVDHRDAAEREHARAQRRDHRAVVRAVYARLHQHRALAADRRAACARNPPGVASRRDVRRVGQVRKARLRPEDVRVAIARAGGIFHARLARVASGSGSVEGRGARTRSCERPGKVRNRYNTRFAIRNELRERMLDIQLLRSDLAGAAQRLADRGYTLDAAAFDALENERKAIQTETQELQARRNQLSKQIGQLQGQEARTPPSSWRR